jgi:uncharacterized protein
MIKKLISIAALSAAALGTFAPAAFAQGPGFDCRAAATYVEIAICDSRELSRLDRVLNREYTNASARTESDFQMQELVSDQENWIGNRDSCSTYSCVLRAYRTRIGQLRAFARY